MLTFNTTLNLRAAGIGLSILSHLVLGLSLIPLAQSLGAFRASPKAEIARGRACGGILARDQSVFNSSHQKAAHQGLAKRPLAELVEIFCWCVTSFCEFVNSSK